MLDMVSGTWTILCKGRTGSALLPMTHAMTGGGGRGVFEGDAPSYQHSYSLLCTE